ncbi:hypothetical protein [Arsenophonus nasoniae]|nr:hypothetical protein [Arsenophonus nasoniae]
MHGIASTLRPFANCTEQKINIKIKYLLGDNPVERSTLRVSGAAVLLRGC